MNKAEALGPLDKVARFPEILQFLGDSLFLSLSYWVYFALRFKSGIFGATSHADWQTVALAGLVLAAFWMLLFWFSGLYRNWYVRSPFHEVFTVYRVTFIGSIALMITVLLDDSSSTVQSSRWIGLMYWLIVGSLVASGRLVVRSVQRRLRESGAYGVRAVIVGCAAKARELFLDVQRAPAWGYRIQGVVLDGEEEHREWLRLQSQEGLPEALGVLGDAPGIFASVRPAEALVSMGAPKHEVMLELASLCTERGVQMKIVPDLYEIFSGQTRTMQIYGTPLIEVSQQLMKPWEEVAKKIVDIAASVAVLVLGLPVWLAVAVIIKLDSPGPVFFAQERVGKNGRVFTLYKFRSMRTDAERNGPQWATMNDPRVTKIGRFIRKTHIDEIPQFWNILKGEMSLVGPRPERPYYVDKFTKEIPVYPRRLTVKPGITGWHQVKYETYNETLEDVMNRLRYDFFYIENMSFTLDLEIIVRTVFRVLKGHGQA